MKTIPAPRAAALFVIIAALVCERAPSQDAAAMTPAQRLELLDETYRSNLRRYHSPVIQDYLRELTRLKQSLAAKSPESVPAVQAEIDRVKDGNGTLSYDPIKPRPDGRRPGRPRDRTAPKVPGASDVPGKMPAPSLVLAAESATRSGLDSPADTEKPAGKAVRVGLAEWRVPQLATGTYRVSVVYSSAASPEGVNLQATLGAETVQHLLTASDATGGINEFRIVRLGVLTLGRQAVDEAFTLKSTDPGKGAVWVRQVILSKP